MDLPAQAVMQLKMFISLVKANPDILHNPSLSFFKDFIESFGGKIPSPSKDFKNQPPPTSSSASSGDAKKSEETPVEPESEESDLELDNSGVIENPDVVTTSLPEYNCDLEVSEEDFEKFEQHKGEAIRAYQDGEYQKAFDCYTKAIEANPNIAAMYAKRGQCCLKMRQPNACVRDCDRALLINSNYAAAYKYRGRAHRLLGRWTEAAQDLRQACKIDMDDEADEWLREVTPNARKLEEHKRKYERKRAERELRERAERVARAREEHAKAAAAAKERQQSGGGGFGGGGEFDPNNFASFLNDPDMKDFMDPEVIAAFEDIESNPANISKYQDNPKILAIIEKLAKLKGGLGGMMGGMGGFNPFGAGGANTPPPQPPTGGGGPDLELD